MLLLLSPAKTLDYESPVAVPAATRPAYMARSAELIERLRRLKEDDVAQLMDLSPALAALNVQRYARWSTRNTARNSRAAVLAFAGDVYGGLQAAALDAADLAWAQDHLVILSGLYGALRPLDALQPYRLEMGTGLTTARGSTLYQYWGDEIARYLNRRQPGTGASVVVNLASQEYFRVVDRRVLKAPVIECVFEDWKNAEWKVIGFFAKRARGLMARHAIRHRVDDPAKLQAFDAEGYRFAAGASDSARWVFRRRVADHAARVE